MKVVCVDNSEIEGHKATLTLEKTYVTLNSQNYWSSVGIKIRNDKGETYYYNQRRFILSDENRERKLKFLGI
jgi:hypothetical protein